MFSILWILDHNYATSIAGEVISSLKWHHHYSTWVRNISEYHFCQPI